MVTTSRPPPAAPVQHSCRTTRQNCGIGSILLKVFPVLFSSLSLRGTPPGTPSTCPPPLIARKKQHRFPHAAFFPLSPASSNRPHETGLRRELHFSTGIHSRTFLLLITSTKPRSKARLAYAQFLNQRPKDLEPGGAAGEESPGPPRSRPRDLPVETANDLRFEMFESLGLHRVPEGSW